jgi:transposase
MLTWEEDVAAAARRAQGWSIAAIARHLGRDPKPIRAYLDGERMPGQRRRSSPDVFAPFADYAAARLTEDRHVWATALYDEVRSLGYAGSYPSGRWLVVVVARLLAMGGRADEVLALNETH